MKNVRRTCTIIGLDVLSSLLANGLTVAAKTVIALFLG
jgi:hypothetical protein